MKAHRNLPVLKFFNILFITELLIILVAWFCLNIGLNLWIKGKTSELIGITHQALAGADWSRVREITKDDPNSLLLQKYRKLVMTLTKQFFPHNDGDISVVMIKDRQEYLLVSSDPTPVEYYGPANRWEMEAYSGKVTYSPQPYADNIGTHLTAFAPILKNGKVIALIAADFDSTSLRNFKGIVGMAFGWAIGPAVLISLLVAFFLASRFVEPIPLIREIQEAKEAAAEPDQKPDDPQWSALTPREKEVAVYVSQGLENNEIAEKMTVSPETVKKHLKNIFQKLDISNRTSLALIAMRQGGPKKTPETVTQTG